MFFGLAEMRIVIILLETGVQLMTDLILVLFTMKPSVLLSYAVDAKPEAMSFFCDSLATLVKVCL